MIDSRLLVVWELFRSPLLCEQSAEAADNNNKHPPTNKKNKKGEDGWESRQTSKQARERHTRTHIDGVTPSSQTRENQRSRPSKCVECWRRNGGSCVHSFQTFNENKIRVAPPFKIKRYVFRVAHSPPSCLCVFVCLSDARFAAVLLFFSIVLKKFIFP